AARHITGHVDFMGLDLRVGRDSPLVAPHARRLVELALRTCRGQSSGELVAAEIGTGCGAIALALATLEPRFTRVYALDPVPAALETARANGARYLMNLVITWLEGASLALVPEPVDVVVWGRIADVAAARAATGWNVTEPAAHLAAAPRQAQGALRPGGALVGAVARAQQPAIAALLGSAYPNAQVGFEPAGADLVIAVALMPRD
ncbi:MAG: hypothetical protein ACHQ4H_16060, partial [Ktedonobacterales bacterium]